MTARGLAAAAAALGLAAPAIAPARIVAGAPQGAERKSVVLRTLNPGDVLYVLLGGGGNSLALVAEEGVVLVDTKSPGWGRPILEAVEAITDQPVRVIVNTHAHLDHTGGNAEIAAPRILAHENAKAAMARMPAFSGPNARFLPTETVGDRMSLLDGRDRIELYYFGPGHTDGDLVVVFPAKRVAYLGDLFPSKAAPVIDTANGGSGVAFPETLARIVAGISGVRRVITGHEGGLKTDRSSDALSVDITTPETMAWSDLEEYADFNRDFLAAVRDAMQAGKTPDEAAATLALPARYAAYDMQQSKANVEAIYEELTAR